ncbi:MAG: hypothetical protein R6U46_03465 [Marinilabilia sp.]
MLRFGPLVFFFLLILFVLPESSRAVEKVDSAAMDHVEAWDHGEVDYRPPPADKIRDWKADARFQYDRKQSPGWWNYVVSRLMYWLFNAAEGRSWFFYLALIIGGLLVLLLLLRFFNIPVSRLLVISRQPEHATLKFTDDGYDHSSSKLKEMFRMFRENGAYRDAVRMMFLLYLRDLHDRGMITLQHFKTNYDYFSEITSEKEKEVFLKRRRLFDIVWYGHAELSSFQYREVEKAFGKDTEGRGGV